MSLEKTARIGVDIGGTFTDLVLHDEARRVTRTGKRLTTPNSPAIGVIEGIDRLLEETNTAVTQVKAILHGTTLVTNTVLERTGATIGLVTTSGFRDILEMGREIPDVHEPLQAIAHARVQDAMRAIEARVFSLSVLPPGTPRASQFALKCTASPDSSSAPVLGSLTSSDWWPGV